MATFLDEGFVVDDQCEFAIHPSVVIVSGDIVCLDSIVIQVEKQLDILDRAPDPRVKTRSFRYHAWVRGSHNVLRYDSPHPHRPHPHKHVYNVFGDGRETEVVDLLREDEIPTLGEVIREVQMWHAANASRVRALR